jgi:acetolactate synthase-1/2/3 large subunit
MNEKPSKEKSYSTGSNALLKSLEANKVQTMFGYPGGVLLGLYDEIYSQEVIRHVLVRHEQGAAHAADGYARVAGKPGVCLATSGPGATNLLTGICSAQMDSIPIIALTGQVPSGMIGKDAFQEADLFNLSLPITKHNYLVRSSENIPRVINEAFVISMNGRPGPVLVDLPKDILNGKFEWDGELPEVNLVGLPKHLPVNEEKILEAAKMILNAERPVLYIGGGVVSSGASTQVQQLAESCNIPFVWTLMGKGAMPDEHPLNLGMLGMHGMPSANFAIYESDLLIAVGVRFDDRATGKLETFAPNAKVIHLDIDPAEIGKNRRIIPGVDISLLGDAKATLSRLNEVINQRKPLTESWLKKVKAWQSEYPLDEVESSDYLTPFQLFKLLNKHAKDAVYTTDVGQHQMWAAQYIKSENPRRWVTSGGLGTMGFGLPAAIGAKAALQDMNIDKPVVCITGDGSFQMCQQELGTVVSHGIPVVSIIMNNGNLGMVRQWQELFYKRQYSFSDLRSGNPDYLKLGEAYGIKGERVSSPKDLEEVLANAIATGQPFILDLEMHPEANVFPIVPPGGSNHRAEGIGMASVPENRSVDDYDKDVVRAPVNEVSNFKVQVNSLKSGRIKA